MPKARGVNALFDRLAALKGKPASAESRTVIAEGLKSPANVVVEKAAKLAGELGFADLCGEFSAAFFRFMRDPKYVDRGCGAKIELARAAVDLKCPAEAMFLAGIRHVQMEGPSYDAAAELRQLSALGLVQIRYPDVMNELVELLIDPVQQARIGAVRALGHTGREDAALLLRMKVLIGDRQQDVIAECFATMMELSAATQLAFVERYLDSEDVQIRDGAALAIGASRHPEAFEVLRQCFERNIDRWPQPTLLLALATCRTSAAMEFLMSLVTADRPAVAVDAIAALALYRHDPNIQVKVYAAVRDCGSDMIKSQYSKHFSPDT
ncbi:MAG TPA: hypothetical protein VIL86_03990 [Tepidisphaeraceae bacterium]|jgi:HEAT repeat protein